MITVTRINDEPIIVNALFVEFVEATPDTVISLISGRKLMVKESLEEVRSRAEAYHRLIGLSPRPLSEPELPLEPPDDQEDESE
jgi:flagellar protein FlbD